MKNTHKLLVATLFLSSVGALAASEKKITCNTEVSNELISKLYSFGIKDHGHLAAQEAKVSCHMVPQTGDIACQAQDLMVDGSKMGEDSTKGAEALSAAIEKCGVKASGHYQVLDVSISCYQSPANESCEITNLFNDGEEEKAPAPAKVSEHVPAASKKH